MFGPLGYAAIAEIRPPGAADAAGAGNLIAPPATLEGGSLSLAFVLTPRPPVSLKEARRVSTDMSVAGWTTILQVKEYLIIRPGVTTPELRTARYVLSRLTAASPEGTVVPVTLRALNLNTNTVRSVIPSLNVPATGFLDFPLQSAIMDAQDVLQIQSSGNDAVHVTASYVNITREPFEVIP